MPEGHAVIFLVGPSVGLFNGRILFVAFHKMAAEHDQRATKEENLVGL